MQNGFFSWDAVGLEWTVPIEEATVFVALPEPTGTNCRRRHAVVVDGCSLTTLASGALRTDLTDLAAAKRHGQRLARKRRHCGAAKRASGAAEDPGSGLVAPTLIAVLAALAGAAAATVLVRRAGRERGGPVAPPTLRSVNPRTGSVPACWTKRNSPDSPRSSSNHLET